MTMRLSQGDLYKVPVGIHLGTELPGGAILAVQETKEDGVVRFAENMSAEQRVFDIKSEIFEQLQKVVPIHCGDKFRLPEKKEIPGFLLERGLLPGSVVIVVDDDPQTGLVTVSTKHGVTFSILADLLWGFKKVGKPKRRRQTKR